MEALISQYYYYWSDIRTVK